ncbi:MAG: hypothetical protein ACOYY3_11000 [Chloroflexota bacterium]
MKKIRIFDDEKRQREKFVEQVRNVGLSEQDFDANLLEPNMVKEAFKIMLERQSRFRVEGYWVSEDKMPLDDIDILIIDNELRDFSDEIGIFTSADAVAYMARCFSTCQLIIVMNRLAHNPFDLTLNLSFQGQLESFSDLEIGEKQLSSKALWGVGEEKFHPWYWPVLPQWLDDFEKRVEDAKGALRTNPSILEFFGLDDVKDWIPRRIMQRLGDGEEYTFLEFLRTSAFALSPKDKVVFEGKDELDERTIESFARVVAARLSKWLEWQILPEMDILVDAPHLLSRFPSLLMGNHDAINDWNSIIVRHAVEVPNLQMDMLSEVRFSKSHWLSRPAWYWRKAMNDERIPDVKEPWNIEYIPYGFCEDTSSFVHEEQAKSFRAMVESPFANRYIEQLDGVDYLPPQRLAL